MCFCKGALWKYIWKENWLNVNWWLFFFWGYCWFGNVNVFLPVCNVCRLVQSICRGSEGYTLVDRGNWNLSPHHTRLGHEMSGVCLWRKSYLKITVNALYKICMRCNVTSILFVSSTFPSELPGSGQSGSVSETVHVPKDKCVPSAQHSFLVHYPTPVTA